VKRPGILNGWPTQRFGVDPGDGRTVLCYDFYLRRHGLSVPLLVAELRGAAPSVPWSLKLIRTAAAAYLAQHGVRPNEKSTDLSQLPPGRSWKGAFQWAIKKQGYSRDDICKPKSWFSREELRRYILRTEIAGYDIRVSTGYLAAYKKGLLDPRCHCSPKLKWRDWEWPASRQHLHGQASVKSKLTWAKVDQIRALRGRGWTLRRLARRFNVVQSNISMICRYETWVRDHRVAA
jgi:hypothetical protein